MTKLTIEDIKPSLEKEGDYTISLSNISLFNMSVRSPEWHIFGLLFNNPNTGLWTARFLKEDLTVVSEESKKEFSSARQILVKEIADYISRGYEITALSSGYDIWPWLQRRK